MSLPRIVCHRCAHYFVTWNPRFPHGCRRMGFVSRIYPGDQVRRAMCGSDCVLFEAKSGASHPQGACKR